MTWLRDVVALALLAFATLLLVSAGAGDRFEREEFSGQAKNDRFTAVMVIALVGASVYLAPILLGRLGF